MMISLHRGMGAGPTAAQIAASQQALQNASQQYGVPLNLLTAVATKESSLNPTAVSPAGAQGLMQLMPATAASLGVTNPFDPQQSANGGAQYLSQLYQQYGDWNTALIAYNQGPGALAQNGPYSSSQAYASSILSNAGMSDGSTVSSQMGPSVLPSPSDASSGVSASDVFGNPIVSSTDDGSTPAPTDYTLPVVAAVAAIAAYAFLS